MFEILVAIAAIVAVVKIASADDQSPLLWGLVTFGLCALSIGALPNLPFIRIGVAAVLAIVLMIGYKIWKDR